MTTIYNLHNCAAWQTGQAYTIGQTVSNGTSPVKAYRCTTAGTSSGTGPTGTGSSIADGTVVWKYLSSVDFTTVAAAAAGVGSIGTLTAPTELWFWNDAEWTISSPITFSGHSTSATNTLTLRAAPGESFRDAPSASSNPLRYDQTKGVGIYNSYNYASWINIQEPYVTLFGLQIRGNGNTGSSCLGNSAAGTNLLVDSCIFDQTYGTGASRGTDSLSGTPVFKNCVVILWTSTSGAVNCFDNLQLYNCTIVRLTNTAAAGTAIAHNYGGLTMVNCAIFGFVALHVGSSPLSFTNCATDLASPPTGFTRFTYASQFQDTGTTTANRDFRLKAGAGLIDAGTVDTTDVPTGVDIYGSTRSTWDIGAYEIVATGTVTNISVSDTATTSETKTATAILRVSPTDTTTTSETKTTTAVLRVSPTDTATSSETTATTAALHVSPTDTATSSETPVATATFQFNVFETGTGSETSPPSLATSATIADTSTTTETFTPSLATSATIADTSTTSETSAITLAIAVSDATTTSELVATDLSLFVFDTTTTSETAQQTYHGNIALTDSATTDTSVTVESSSGAVDVADTTSASETCVVTFTTHLTASDTATTSETPGITTSYHIANSDTTNSHDDTGVGQQSSNTDSVTCTDSIDVSHVFGILCGDTVTTSEANVIVYRGVIVAYDTAQTTDSGLTGGQAIAITIGDTASVFDGVAFTSQVFRPITMDPPTDIITLSPRSRNLTVEPFDNIVSIY